MNEEERKAKESQLESLRVSADAAHQAAADKPEDEAAQKAADAAEDAFNELKSELDAAPPATASEDEGKEDEGEEEDIDFEKELKDLEGNDPGGNASRSEREKAERALFFNAKRLRELGGDPEKVLKPKEETPPPPPPKEEEEEERYVTKDDFAEQHAEKLSKSEAQRKVIMWHYKHSIKKTGNVVNDIENAFFIANKGRIRRSIEEIRRAGDVRISTGNGPGRRPAPRETRAPQLSSRDQSILARRGFKPNSDGTFESKRYVMRFVTGKGWVTERKK